MGNLVVCPEQQAARVGRDVFAAGGNAIDAAISTAFAQSVVSPMMCSLGGTGLLYYFDAGSRERVVLNCGASTGSRPIPSSWQREFVGRSETVGRYVIESEANQMGYQSVMTPGFVRGCWVAYQRFASGRLSWSELLQPSIRLAKDGVELDSHLADTWGGSDVDYAGETKPGYPGLMEKLALSPFACRTFLNSDGSRLRKGDRLIQPTLAETLQQLADAGGDDFYNGEIARTIQRDFENNEGFITRDDLHAYTVDQRKPISGRYNELEITSTPNSSGSHIIQMLQILSHFDLSALGHNTPEYIDTFARVQRATFADNVRLKGMDPEKVEPLEAAVIDPARAEYWAERIKSGDRVVVREGTVDSGTTHLTAMDEQGNALTFTHSVGSIAGSGVATPELGFLYNNFLGHYNPLPDNPDSIVPGKKIGAGLPTIVYRDDEPYIVIGAPGGSRLITSAAQATINAIAHGMSMGDAVSVPRFHSEEDQLLFLEPALSDDVESQLVDMGNDVRRSTYMSCVQAIRVRPDDGYLEAGADPRGGAGLGRHP